MSPRRRDADRPPKVRDRDRPVGRAASSPREQGAVGGPEGRPVGEAPGRGLICASWAGTAVLAAIVAAGVVAIDDVGPLVVAVSGALFVLGSVAFFVAYAIAVGRSRHELIGIGGLYFMSGTAPAPVRRSMMWSLGLQVALVVVAVAARPFSSLVFTSLAPVFGLGLAGWWVARHGRFAPRAR
ncbi:hypothetical protein [Actinomarinicola tropica]|uniref:Uncharacterized protein n=1 Tax=Actinomarinicola tropica TaxID=2789776 RepID=A0A5Q2RFG5_9ACTN|nr:hypothetical protein [Actinomarinicola tropica]QGG95578.1 hypothetical protein GH723_10995 [Actinomarinicola tropica]